jgi:hypothetical protein
MIGLICYITRWHIASGSPFLSATVLLRALVIKFFSFNYLLTINKFHQTESAKLFLENIDPLPSIAM